MTRRFFAKQHLFLGIFLLALFSNNTAFASFDQPLLMYVPFDTTTHNMINNEFGIAKNVALVEGKVGKGGLFERGSYLRFPARGNINFRRGTVEFWVKPNWDGDDGGYHYFFAGNIDDAKNVNSIHVSKKFYEGGVVLGQIDGEEDNEGRAKEEAVVPGGKTLSPASVASWRKDTWHHVAFSWDDKKRTIKLYINGVLRATNNRVPEGAFPSLPQSYINIGSSIDERVFAEAVIDEVKIWDHPKSDLEIAEAAGLKRVEKGVAQKENEKSSGSKRVLPHPALAGLQSVLAKVILWIKSLY